ncbi:unnamed protein product [Somion occarium]|uniref:Transmembrane protein n=1 Tax=Somion occarium TaxID=3059160 RepID=A0ABP1DJ42_9APHY
MGPSLTPSESRDVAVFLNITHICIGVYLWEFLMSLDFDWSFVSGKRKFKWTMVFYYLVRYIALASNIVTLVAFDVTTKMNCKAVFAVFRFTGNAVGGLATINLALRAIAVWNQRWYICVFITLLILGHWTLILHGILVEGVYSPGQGCVLTYINNKILAANLVYSMCIDFIVLALTGWKLLRLRSNQRKGLVGLLFQDGLIYFASSFCANLVATVLMVLNLSPLMNVLFNIPAAMICAIASTRAVRSLARWTQDGPHIFYSDASLPSSTGDIEWRVPPDQSDAFSSATRNTRRHTADAVRVQITPFVDIEEPARVARKSTGRKNVVSFDF